ncbi:MAG: tyrosine-type recombinase/integrase [Planctomycetota bacterium]
MNDNSTPRRTRGKARPKPPRKDFPLGIHKGTGYWCKKVKGRVHYFGRVADDPKGVAALEEWNRVKEDLYAEREPRAKADELSVADLCNQFLTHHGERRDHGEISPRTFQGLYGTCAIVVDVFGRGRAVADLAPPDFGTLRKKLAETRGLVALRNEIARTRSVFKFAFDNDLILRPVKFGSMFGKPSKDAVSRAREEHRSKFGDKMFESHEIRAILAEAPQPLRSMILLAANGGFGQSDLARLPIRAVDLDKGWIDFARVKTGVPRRVPLWPESVEAIREWLPIRAQIKAKDKGDAGLVFLTCQGNRWVRLPATRCPTDSVGLAFNKVLKKLAMKRPRVSFYALRHGFETVAGETADQIAVDAIMGHKPQGMSATYRERIGDDRLRRVVDHVRQWLFAADDAPEKADQGTDAPEPADAQDDEPDAGFTLKLFAG